MGEFKGFWVMESGERDEQYLRPVTADEVADQLREMGYVVGIPGSLDKFMNREHLQEVSGG